MDARAWLLCAALLVFWGLAIDSTQAQYGGGAASDHAAKAKKELQSAMERVEGMMIGGVRGETTVPLETCLCVGETDTGSIAKIEQALRAPLRSTGLDFVDTPLVEVVNLIQEDYGIPVELDIPALDEMGMDAEEPVTVGLHNISLRSALRLILKQLGLVYVIHDEVLMITTPDEAEARLKVCVYDVRDLIDVNEPKGVQALVDVIVSCAATKTWSIHGGSGEIRPLPPNLLVISQSFTVHEELRGLLATVREMRARPAHVESVDPGAGEQLRQLEPGPNR